MNINSTVNLQKKAHTQLPSDFTIGTYDSESSEASIAWKANRNLKNADIRNIRS